MKNFFRLYIYFIYIFSINTYGSINKRPIFVDNDTAARIYSCRPFLPPGNKNMASIYHHPNCSSDGRNNSICSMHAKCDISIYPHSEMFEADLKLVCQSENENICPTPNNCLSKKGIKLEGAKIAQSENNNDRGRNRVGGDE